MKKVCVNIEWRKPRNKMERGCYGVTDSINSNIIDVFLQQDMSREQSVDTFFHELAHVFFRCYKSKKKISDAEEERLASLVGRVVASILREK